MHELAELILSLKGFVSRIAAEASLVEMVTLVYCGILLYLLREERKDRIAAYLMAFSAQKESIGIAQHSLETTGKLAVIIQSLKTEMKGDEPNV